MKRTRMRATRRSTIHSLLAWSMTTAVRFRQQIEQSSSADGAIGYYFSIQENTECSVRMDAVSGFFTGLYVSD